MGVFTGPSAACWLPGPHERPRAGPLVLGGRRLLRVADGVTRMADLDAHRHEDDEEQYATESQRDPDADLPPVGAAGGIGRDGRGVDGRGVTGRDVEDVVVRLRGVT